MHSAFTSTSTCCSVGTRLTGPKYCRATRGFKRGSSACSHNARAVPVVVERLTRRPQRSTLSIAVRTVLPAENPHRDVADTAVAAGHEVTADRFTTPRRDALRPALHARRPARATPETPELLTLPPQSVILGEQQCRLRRLPNRMLGVQHMVLWSMDGLAL